MWIRKMPKTKQSDRDLIPTSSLFFSDLPFLLSVNISEGASGSFRNVYCRKYNPCEDFSNFSSPFPDGIISLLYSFLSSFTLTKGKILYLHLSWNILLKCIFRSLQIGRHDPRLFQEQIHIPHNSLELKKLKGLETL